MSTWAVSHSSVLVGTAIVGGSYAIPSINSLSTWGYVHLTTRPLLAKTIVVGASALSVVDDAAVLYSAHTGDPDAIGTAMVASRLR